MTAFTVTRDGVPYGTWALTDDLGWQWNGEGAGPLLEGRIANVYRRGGFLSQLGLLPEASWEDELNRTWGIKHTDTIEFVPMPNGQTMFVPVIGASSLSYGTAVKLSRDSMVGPGGPLGTPPRSLPVLLETLGVNAVEGKVVASVTGYSAKAKPYSIGTVVRLD